ncbi:hypothetical protein MCOR19_000262 [Pyricularia oryzae]|nr:hypothetical protein MCOR19_000262 [Pyricularia oryzae]KAI6459597.1 hypothetical protein MCOR15_005888 [Pyricularia oryzae]KAI6493914.1 hypothetical protein MCOR18_001309 [Pyricularia oryzae]KAI6533977.1 hypothetical protein MCOR16_003363 [Pyricularia oryzae]QBZ61590.1 hypothetical protein PoMZ_08542 [Pyricularia oryzae]
MLRMMTHFKMPSNSFLFSVGSPRANSAQATLTDELQLVIFRLQACWPSTLVLLIRTVFPDLALRSFVTLRARLQRARDADAIASILTPASAAEGWRKEVLLHFFSHGGSKIAIQLLTSTIPSVLRNRLGFVVFDSCPGDASFDKAYRTALVSLPPSLSPSLRRVGTASTYCLVLAVQALQNAELMSSVRELRAELNSASLIGEDVRRLYLFSAGDVMVGVDDVVSHAREAQSRIGEDKVGAVLFQTAPHCALIVEDADRYWGAIVDAWEGNGKLPPVPEGTEAEIRARL